VMLGENSEIEIRKSKIEIISPESRKEARWSR
jgi:hypothetical protein